MSQILLWGFVYTHFLRGVVGFLHTGHSYEKVTLQFFPNISCVLYHREGDVGCQIAKEGCKKRIIEIG